jgi:PhoPQ-activated pathogenicity-related protein
MGARAFCVHALSALGILSLSAAGAAAWTGTALDRYVARPDPHYRYELIRTFSGAGYTGYVLSLTSQQWRTAREVDRPIWRHWLVIVRPDRIATHTGLLVVSGGSNDKPPPHDVNPLLIRAALTTRSVVGEVRMVPNEPLTFADDGRPRNEDAIIAYSWRKFLLTGDETWPLRLPMTKSVVRAMDAVTSFCASPKGGAVRVDKFVLGGASKRGWTAWSAAAVDRRVVAIVPVVIDLLNIEASFEHQYRSYGFWAPAIADFVHAGIMQRRDAPRFAALMRIEDPYSYRDRLTMAKFIVNSAGDQYFLPDSSQFYFAGLKGETYLRYIPNTDHRLRGSDAADSALAFYQSIVAHTPRPRFTWRFQQDGAIRVDTGTRPLAVKLWQAHNPNARDFRLEAIGPAYAGTDLTDRGGGVYIGSVPPPRHGWTAYFVEMTFPGPGAAPFKFTTGVRVTPDRLPYGPPPKEDMTDPEPAHGR